MALESVLLVEDAVDMQVIVRATIGSECDLVCATSLNEAEQQLHNGKFALIILDVHLPDGTGFEWCKRLRADSKYKDLPVIFLTGEREIQQRVHGFEVGADDYVTKPLEPNEFKARVQSKLKRKRLEDAKTEFTVGVFNVDFSVQKAFLNHNGANQELALTPIEFKLLVQFLRNENRVFSREELLIAVWGQTVHVSGHTVDTHISSLRKKVGAYGHYFKAVVKRGYCFTPDDTKSTKSA